MGRWSETPIHEMGFAPDLAPQTRGIIADSTNLYPSVSGVASLPIGVLRIPAEAAATQTKGTFSARAQDKIYRVTKGTRTHLFHSASPFVTWAEWDNGQVFTMASDAFWSFAMHGDDIYASNGYDALQKSTAGAQFAALTASVGSVPIGSFNVVIQPGGLGFFLMVLCLSTDSTAWAVCGVGNDQDWGYNVATLSATGFLAQSPGPITAAATLRGGVVAWKATSMYYGQLAAPPFPFTFQLISEQVGTIAPLSVVSLGDAVAFLGPDDFYLFDGYTPRPIPNQLKEFFFRNVLVTGLPTVRGRYDAFRETVFWHWPRGSSAITEWVAWSRRSGRWTHGTLTIWDTFVNNIPVAATPFPAYIDATGAAYYYPLDPAGNDTTATLTTYDIGADDDSLIAIQRAKPHWKLRPAGAQSMTSVVKTFPGTTGTAGVTVASQDSQDYFDFIQTSRWQTLTFSFAGGGEIDSIGLEQEWAGVQ